VTVAFFALCTNILAYFLTYLYEQLCTSKLERLCTSELGSVGLALGLYMFFVFYILNYGQLDFRLVFLFFNLYFHFVVVSVCQYQCNCLERLVSKMT